MKIDIIIGNPPYQEETGAGTIITGKKPIYQDFVLNSIEWSSEKICLIIPSRWTMRRTGLEQLYDKMSSMKNNIRSIVDYMTWDNAVFGEQVQIAGGIMYFLIDKKYTGDCIYKNIDKTTIDKVKRKLDFESAFIRNNKLVSICHKVQELKEDTLINMCRTNTFGLDSFERGTETGNLKLLTSSGWFSIQREKIVSGIQSIEKYKLAISGTTPGGGASGTKGVYKVLSKMTALTTGQVCTNTYITIGDFDSLEAVINLIKYLQTKFIRALILATIGSMHIIPYSFTYVPIPDMEGIWTDKQLYEKYKLSVDEIDYIERTISPWQNDLNNQKYG